ncbi:hypothetical protein [Lewinella sp. JB7]|uniref:hypothetical protein n=1 Tax=Lewinella sp. JB7 TaxID=2962887 RepID=UPI0020C9AF3E|nr:hypothetical protein [Lewinella sp. JB7]MCP9235730.1 hypothetical protein [Lewinella sp. JB7]
MRITDHNIRIERRGNELLVTYSWRTPATYALLVFSLIWDGLLYIFLLFDAGWPIVFHLLVAALLLYSVVALFVNTTVVSATARELRVTHGPLPTWMRHVTIPARDIRRLYVDAAVEGPAEGATAAYWQLRAERVDGSRINLLYPHLNRDLLTRLEREIAVFLQLSGDGGPEHPLKLPGENPVRHPLPAKMRQREETVPASPPRPLPRHRLSRQSEPFALCRVEEGQSLLLAACVHRVLHTTSINWENAHHPRSRVIVLSDGWGKRYFHAEMLRGRWAYYEERPLNREELTQLGFSGAGEHPGALVNGGHRYYPDEQRRGDITNGPRRGETLVQYTYFTTRSYVRFRAYRIGTDAWKVCVQEPVDAAVFTRCNE